MNVPITILGASAADLAVTWFTFPCRGALVELGALAVLPVVDSGVLDNFWHNDLFARICSTCGGGEWHYLVDLPVNLLALFLLPALWTPCDCVAELPS